jgi:hypothetical protein
MNKIIKISEVLLESKELLLKLEQIDKRIEKQNEKLDMMIMRLSRFLDNREGLKLKQHRKFLD